MRTRAPLIALLLAAVTIACSPPSAEDLVMEVIATRNQFEANLSSWVDRDTDTAAPYLYLDVDVVKDTEASLSRLTVLVQQVDANGNVLDEQRVAIDVSDMNMRGLSKKYGLEVRPLAPGVEGVTLAIEPNPARETWADFPELGQGQAARPVGTLGARLSARISGLAARRPAVRLLRPRSRW